MLLFQQGNLSFSKRGWWNKKSFFSSWQWEKKKLSSSFGWWNQQKRKYFWNGIRRTKKLSSSWGWEKQGFLSTRDEKNNTTLFSSRRYWKHLKLTSHFCHLHQPKAVYFFKIQSIDKSLRWRKEINASFCPEDYHQETLEEYRKNALFLKSI